MPLLRNRSADPVAEISCRRSNVSFYGGHFMGSRDLVGAILN